MGEGKIEVGRWENWQEGKDAEIGSGDHSTEKRTGKAGSSPKQGLLGKNGEVGEFIRSGGSGEIGEGKRLSEVAGGELGTKIGMEGMDVRRPRGGGGGLGMTASRRRIGGEARQWRRLRRWRHDGVRRWWQL